MKRLIILLMLVYSSLAMAGLPDTISLDYLQAQAKANYPLIKQRESLIQSYLLRLENYKVNYYPKVDLNGQATYQSDVTSVSLPIPTIHIPTPDKDQYKVTVDINQVIYDGGVTKMLIEQEKSTIAADTLANDVDLYQIRERINQVFFSILLIQEKTNLINLAKADLLIRHKTVESMVKNGVVVESELLVMQSEMIKLDQQLTDLEYTKIAALNILSLYINQKIPTTAGFNVPNQIIGKSEIVRPELALFNAQKARLDATIDLTGKKRMPKLYGFAQLGYGKPGLNMFKTEASDLYIVGAKVSWNIWDWNQNKNERQILSIQKNLIQNQQEVFERNIKIAQENELANMSKAEQMLKQDEALIKLREKISKYTFSQVENGVKTSADYINDSNAELNAKINYRLHQIQILQAKVNYNNLIGK